MMVLCFVLKMAIYSQVLEVNREMILWIQTHGFFKDKLAIQSKILINKWQEIYKKIIPGKSEVLVRFKRIHQRMTTQELTVTKGAS